MPSPLLCRFSYFTQVNKFGPKTHMVKVTIMYDVKT